MTRRIPASLSAACVLLAALAVLPAPRAEAAITCHASAALYAQCGRVFPDPEAGLGTDPNAEGLLPAADFIQFGTPGGPGPSEIWDGLKFLQSQYDRYLEVWTLEDLLENPDAKSSGLWVAGQRQRMPLILARVTDESVPTAQKRRFVFGLSLHGIERAGAEGGTRALEDFVTYSFCESLGDLDAARANAICAKQTQIELGEFEEGQGGFPVRLLPWDAKSLTMGEVLKHSELYFTYNNPDGWHRGDRVGGVSHYQRYTGNGVDPNRDWPTVGYTFRPFSPGSEPETKYFAEALKARGGNWASGIDLHGQGGAPVLTYTMLPAGRNDYAKNARIRAIAQQTQKDGLTRLTWSPLIVPYDATRRSVNTPIGPVGQMYPQRWGTVWDTIDYTTTGSYGDWINSPRLGLGAIGMDNEMSLSHITNCGLGSCYLPEIEQLHVAGNKGLIYADIDTTLRTESIAYRFPFEARGAYVRYDNMLSSPAKLKGLADVKLPPQDDITGLLPCTIAGCTSPEFDVKGTGDGVYNAGMTVDIGFVGTHTANDFAGSTFTLQRLDESHGQPEWEDVTTSYNFNQGPYLPNAATVTVNDPVPGAYRFTWAPGTPGPYTYEISFSNEPAHADPGQLAYRASNFDFFDDVNKYLPAEHRFQAPTSAAIIDQPSVLRSYDVVVLVDDPLDGWDEEKPSKSRISRGDHDAYYAALEGFVKDGGTLVLLDGAMRGLADLTGKKNLAAHKTLEYAGWIGFRNADGPTYDTDPLAKGVNVPGAAEGPENRHQTYEPVPLGYQIDVGNCCSPVWFVEADALGAAGGRIAGFTTDGASLGELKMGKGSIRFSGALLPTPTDKYDHPFGVESYALTYSGWQVFENLVNVKARAKTQAPEPEVLGGRVLPKTGRSAPAWLLFLLLIPAVAVARRLRDVYWT